MGRHSIPPAGGSGDDDTPSGRIARSQGDWQGRRRRADAGRRGVSVGVIAALVVVVVLLGGAILWRFFGHALSRRSTDAARQCLQGTAAVAVVADASIAEVVQGFADHYNDEAGPVGDKCVKVTVTKGDSDAVVNGLTGTWPADLGERPALWIPASTVGSARLQTIAGKQIVSDARSLVTSPVVLAVRPQLKEGLSQLGWAALPGLQSNPTSMDGLNLPGWGSLRLALPTAGGADATYLVAEAVAAASAPPDAPGAATAGIGAASALLADAPRLTDNSANTAWDALVADGDPAAAPVHAVAMTEQQLFQRTSGMSNAKDTVAEWFPGGPVALADYPTVLLSGDWLAEEQVTAASEFARYMRKSEQLDGFAKAGFRAGDIGNDANDVVSFGPLGSPLPVGDDDAARAAVAGVVSPAGGAATTVMLNQNLAAVAPALKNRLGTLPPSAAAGLWTFNGVDSAALIPTGPLSDDLAGQPRGSALAGALDGVVAVSGSGGVSFTTLRMVYNEALANYRPGQPNSILVITQGPHTDRTLDGPGLEDFIRSAADPARPVAVNIIDVGDDPDRATWESVAKLSGGGYQNVPAADSPDLVAAVGRMLG